MSAIEQIGFQLQPLVVPIVYLFIALVLIKAGQSILRDIRKPKERKQTETELDVNTMFKGLETAINQTKAEVNQLRTMKPPATEEQIKVVSSKLKWMEFAKQYEWALKPLAPVGMKLLKKALGKAAQVNF